MNWRLWRVERKLRRAKKLDAMANLASTEAHRAFLRLTLAEQKLLLHLVQDEPERGIEDGSST